jgi:hypothetical protein
MGQIESAATRHQQLAPRGWHGVVDSHGHAGLRDHLGGHQPGGAGANNGDLDFGWIGHGKC